jgi:predicted HD phosphohydrolase
MSGVGHATESPPKHYPIFNLLHAWGSTQNPATGVEYSTEALRAARWAVDVGLAPHLILGALCHNVGHLLLLAGEYSESYPDMGEYRPYLVAGSWLQNVIGLSKQVADPVRMLLPSLRYQASVERGYVQNRLSEHERTILKDIGGPMSQGEARQLRAHPQHRDGLQLWACVHASKNYTTKEDWDVAEALAAAGMPL